MSRSDRPTVLVVDDESDLVDLYAEWLAGTYEVRTATAGSEALAQIDETVDVVLLDRRMPGLSGDDVLGEIRRRGLSCRVAMVTAVEPDIDILDLGFDEYVIKPVTREELFEVVDAMVARTEYDSQLQEYFSLVSKYAALESRAVVGGDLDPEYEALESRIDRMKRELHDQLSGFDERDLKAVFRTIEHDQTEFMQVG